MAQSFFLIALGSNKRHGRHGAPERVITAALDALAGDGAVTIHTVSPIIKTAPLGPSIRRYANAAALIETSDTPPALLTRLKAIEAAFGRRRGRRWGARVIDLDIILWSDGIWASAGLSIPHVAYHTRDFVLKPLTAIAPDWRDPVRGRTVRQMAWRLKRGMARDAGYFDPPSPNHAGSPRLVFQP